MKHIVSRSQFLRFIALFWLVALGAARVAVAQADVWALGFDGLQPPTQEYMQRATQHAPPRPEFFLGPRWSGVQGSPKVVTWSLVPDGVVIPSVIGENAGVSSLFARMDALFATQGGRATWVQRVQESFDRWEQLTGIDFQRIQSVGVDWDDGASWGSFGSATRGDIRLAMKRLDGPGGVTVVAAFPGNGDILLDRFDTWETAANLHRVLRNSLMWAQGIACGVDLVCPADGTKLMEPIIPFGIDGPQQDDIRAMQRHYGDPNELDDVAANATPLGAIAIGNSVSVGAVPPPLTGPALADIALTSIDADGEVDLYSFSVAGPAVASMTVTPVGSVYDNGPNNGGTCSSFGPFDALAVADLNVELLAADGTSVIATGSSSAAGVAEVLSLVPLNGAGTYYVRVLEGNSPASPQSYSLQVSITACTVDSDGDGVADCNDGCPLDPLKLAPGVCGCGTSDVDSDGDGTADCQDGCSSDPLKVSPGACGCGTPETDSDGDGTPNCIDGCPVDPLKVTPGICGCGVSDVDSDGDTVADCLDGCPADPLKVAPGVCGCGTPDTDSDGDGTPNCNDQCPNDPFKVLPGTCGCGVADTDSDGDGTPNCHDGCPSDPLKVAPGVCGCGTPDVDSDGDGTLNCHDGCPNDPLKIAPGVCGCGVADTDSDGDGTPDCNDQCPLDPLKIALGQCGCGVLETDSDGDGTADCVDGCALDPLKTAPGFCGCGNPEIDSDGDGVPDCADGCPADPLKIATGQCGCGVPDTDSDGDGVADCIDGCPADPFKASPGICGCGVPDNDSDGDGTVNCLDGCPNDPLKVAPGVCGCGVADVDTDGDGTLDCNDGCPTDPSKTAPGVCGCNVADVDSDGDGTLNCLDGCPNDPLKTAPGVCGCGVIDLDADFDGTMDCIDNCVGLANPSQADADNDGRGDACDNCPLHVNPDQADCDGDLAGDVCEIATGAEIDCDINGIPDSCEPDCNLNGRVDACDILLGTSLDINGDQIPDDCQALCPAIQSYCTGKVNSLGCTPVIGWSGAPSAAQTSGFMVTCSNTIADRSGQLFYGYAASSAPFQGGYLCVKPPFRRTYVQLSTGSNVGCAGTYSFDFNVWMASGIDPLLVPGVNVFARWWMRDPQASFTTGFSNAVTFTICP
ncbi:MAG: thrombospondin type 3 repeat-containing protein [Planctomycetes bacterium]|nr:thrombospondin type 3 repeat-containing protein [Planctomycetota bacterium]